jgi:hypothetical protein
MKDFETSFNGSYETIKSMPECPQKKKLMEIFEKIPRNPKNWSFETYTNTNLQNIRADQVKDINLVEHFTKEAKEIYGNDVSQEKIDEHVEESIKNLDGMGSYTYKIVKGLDDFQLTVDENKNVTSSIVYNTEEDARDVIKDYELSHQDKKYAIKLIRGEILDSFYKEV